ncbi:MAG: thrombospondin type 3 repeat-containing protein, partial [Verrucomicrobiales bacterium]
DSDGDGFADGLEVAQGTSPTNASNFPSNIAPRATAIIGTRGSIEDGVDAPHANAGPPQAINDFNLDTRVDTFGGNPGVVSYVGLIWNTPLTNEIERLELSMATFYDGGWFGPNGVGPGGGGILNSNEFLIEPTLQVTRDGGTTWETVAHTSNYLEIFEGHAIAPANGAPTRATATFRFVEAQTGINGLRFVGSEGGEASQGFIGVFELSAFVETTSAPTGVTIQNVALNGNQIRFDVDTTAGSTHVVQFKNDLSETAWQTLTTLTGDGTRKQVTDAATNPHRFYRVSTQ